MTKHIEATTSSRLLDIPLFIFTEPLMSNGRIGRLYYCTMALLSLWPLGLGALLILTAAIPETLTNILLMLGLVYWTVAQYCLAIRRLHDMGLSGWWSLLLWAAWPVLLLIPGQRRENRYGIHLALSQEFRA